MKTTARTRDTMCALTIAEVERHLRSAVLAEREACAALADAYDWRAQYPDNFEDVANWIAAAIRARG